MKRKTEKLTCYQVQHSIKEYLLDEMSLPDAVAYVKHVRSCRECLEELEEYYAFSQALMPLEELDNGMEKGNFGQEIENRLERTEQTAAKQKKEHRARQLIYTLLVIVLAAVMGVSIGV